MSTTAAGPAAASRWAARLDPATGALGLLVLVVVVALDPQLPSWPLWGAVPLIVLACKWSVRVPTGSADVLVIGLEPCLLLLLALLAPPPVALLVWACGSALSELLSHNSNGIRLFNTGLGILSGAAAVLVLTLLPPARPDHVQGLAIVLLAAATYFAVDLIWSTATIALVDGRPVHELVGTRALAIGLACSTAVNGYAFLAWVVLTELPAVAVLLLVPFGALLLASHSWSTMRRAQELAAALSAGALALQAATTAPEVERLLEEHAALIARAPSAALLPGSSGDDRMLFRPDGAPARSLYLAARPSAAPFGEAERQAVALLLGLARREHERHSLIAQLHHNACYDALTGLVNRRRFEQLLDEAVTAGRPAALLYGDLDGFKAVNDRHGHAAGDALLVEVGVRLAASVRAGDVCARLGGDEFVVLLDRLPLEPSDRAAEATRVAERVRAALAADYPAAEGLTVRASLGLVPVTADGADEVLRRGDEAMYLAKAAGGGQVVTAAGGGQVVTAAGGGQVVTAADRLLLPSVR